MSTPPVAWFVGLTTLDIVHYAAMPAPNQKVTATRQDVAAGGPAANAALTAVACGVTACLITALGEGPVAGVVSSELESAGVNVLDTAWLDLAGQERHDFTIGVSAVLIDPETGERSVVSGDGALSEAPAPTAAQLDQLVLELGWPEVVMFDGHHPQIAEAVLAWVAASDAVPGQFRPLVVVDGGRWRPIFEKLLAAADIAALSDDFVIPGAGDVITAARGAGARAVVVTHGPDPVDWSSGTSVGQIEVPEVEAKNTAGAGDVFHGALVAAIANGDGVPAAAKKAVATASERVKYPGQWDWLAPRPMGG